MSLFRTSCAILMGLLVFLACERNVSPPTQPPGQQTSVETKALATGATLLQSDAPLEGFNIYMNGFHPMKANPGHAMEAHHFCKQINEDIAQCVLFDGNTASANMTGVEYIISERLYATLPAEEKQYWHPHNYEILSGQLVLPGLPDAAEKQTLAKKMNSYGKTWHVWNTGMPERPRDRLPLGPPQLAWSFNADGEAPPAMVDGRDKRLGIDGTAKRKHRANLIERAKPQEGVDALAGAYSKRRPIPGVVEQ